ncbi:MAG TPA: hypothetical protein VKA85_06530 [Candidatus Limnocylindrales bacterium]|nr:hypothetical protein [Candidatus Limnocylindrales bacterium]
MTDGDHPGGAPEPPARAPEPPAADSAGPRSQQVIADYYWRHRDSFTPAALRASVVRAGYSEADADAARLLVDKHLAAESASAPTLARARRTILVAYVVTYVAFAIVFLLAPSSYGSGQIALMILTVVLGIALAISLAWARRSRWKTQGTSLGLGVVLSVPIVLLVLVAGSCAWTTFPYMIQ